MNSLILATIYAIFFLSGAAALIYQVVWIRSLSLVFGGSHLAVATVLTVFMAGLALGGYVIGKRVSGFKKLLRLYGFLELGIAAFALVFLLLLRIYPPVYIFLAQFAPTSPIYLTSIRVSFAALALIGPTTLMGGTLPVLSGLVSGRAKTVGTQLSFLYGFNTLGAVIGASVAGFILLRYLSISTTMSIAILINVVVGILAIVLQDKAQAVMESAACQEELHCENDRGAHEEPVPVASLRLVLWGVGVSGFCALGYEVLWTRILSIVIGASVYGFTIMLVAFLTGIASGSAAYGLFLKGVARGRDGALNLKNSIVGFGLVQVTIGVTALVVSICFIDLPVNKPLLMKYFLVRNFSLFESRLWANVALSFSYMFVPAFFMGVAFPLAGRIHAGFKQQVGRTVGEVLAYNTVGAILGSACSGFLLIYLVGIERSLQLLIVINIGFGLLVVFSLLNSRRLNWCVCGLTVVVLMVLAFNPQLWRIWDSKWLATYKTNELEAYNTRESLRNEMYNSEVLYYGEGVEAIISSVRLGNYQGFITNGRTESSNTPVDLQCVYTLGHLPMLLAKNPKNIFVLGTGAGMTLGATSVYPSVEKVTLVEIEPKVLGVARTFGRYNHDVLDNPKLNIVFNDGRNFLMTSREKYDVITADPIHPWFSGAGYLYTDEYFRLASEHLNPGGIICQWLPIYELTNENLRSVVNTFRRNFKYTMLWLTHYDVELVGSNTPIVLDEAELTRRMQIPEVARDLKMVQMGSTSDFLSYFIMGDDGARKYSHGGIVNSDDNVYLEFSAPISVGRTSLVAENIAALAQFRESIIPYLRHPASQEAAKEQSRDWQKREVAAPVVDQLHALYYRNDKEFEYVTLMQKVERNYPDYAPYKIMWGDYKQTYRY